MNNNDLSQMQQEIARLNKIITVLLEQIDLLKINCWHLQQQMAIKQVHDRQVLQPMGINKENDSHVQQEMGMNEMHPSHVQQDTGINKENPSHVLQDMGINKMHHSHVQQDLPIKQMNDSRLTQDLAIKQMIDTNVPQDMPPMQVIYPELQQPAATIQVIYSLPATLDTEIQNIGLLRRKLGEVILKRSRDSARNGAAKLLIHFYNKGTGKYEELQKLIGYSNSGLAKLMILMRRKGLITRTSFQRFAPSPKALQLMQEAKLK